MGALLPMESRGVHSVVKGEAVAVEVLPGRWLFALLSGDDDALGQADQLVYSAFRLGQTREVSDRTYDVLMADLKAQPLDTPVPVPPESYPLLVTFDDITKPESVRAVDPADIAATFGPGVTLHGLTLEVTDEGVTEGIVGKILNWLGPNEKSSFSGLEFFDPSRPNPLNYLPKNTLKQD